MSETGSRKHFAENSSVFFHDTIASKPIHEQLQLQATILQNVSESVIVTDLQGQIIYWNKGATNLFGYSAQEMLGNTPATLYPDMEMHQLSSDLEQIREGKDYINVWKGRHKDGTTVWIDVKTSLLRTSEGTAIGFIGVGKDITERKQIEEQRRELEQRKDEFMGMASHELKTPITSLKGYTQLLKRKLEKQGLPESVALLNKMERQLTRLNKLISDLLDVSKIQAGKLDYAQESIDIDALIHEIADTIQQISTTHTITIHGASHAKIIGDSDRLRQVFSNLISNAVKYSPKANQVDIYLAASQNTVTVSIQDYGIGIPREHQQKIFDRFYRVSGLQDKTFPGLGMGLYISLEIVKRHGGRVWVESTGSKGATFLVSLPVA
jgi:PAS domain S-box-containing protein